LGFDLAEIGNPMLRDVYHPAIYEFDAPAPSYWEATTTCVPYPALEGDQTADIAIIGGGYLGLTIALILARDHKADVAVVDAGHIGWGASGRNGGFNSGPAMKLSVSELIAKYGVEEARRYYHSQVEGQQIVADIASDEAIDIDRAGDGIYVVAPSRRAFDGLTDYHALLRDKIGAKVALLDRAAFAEIGHDGPEQHGALHKQSGFGIHPLKYAVGLGAAATRHGARLYAHSRITGWTKDGTVHRLSSSSGTLRAKRVVVAANGYLSDGLHPALDARVMPAISNIIVTRPLTKADLAQHRFATLCPLYNTRSLLYYYRRLPDDRILFGARGDTVGDPASGEQMRARMQAQLACVFPCWAGIEIDYFWRGLVAVTAKRLPSFGALPDDNSVHYGFGCHGSGINNAAYMGTMLARQIIGKNDTGVDLSVPAPYRDLPPRLGPGGPVVRRLGLKMAYGLYGVTDRWSNRA
jgi:glycine/D-amino acid oxidase-like deaminating enzyme